MNNRNAKPKIDDRTPFGDILDICKKTGVFDSVRHRLEGGGRKVHLTGLPGSSKSLFLAFLFTELSRTTVVITGSQEEAEIIRDDLEAFLGAGAVRSYPARDALPWDEKPIPEEVMGSRLETLADLLGRRPVIVVLPSSAVAEKILSPERLRSAILNFTIGQTEPFDQLASRFTQLGFQREPMVEQVGQFSIRGGIVDLYPYAVEQPLRMEFFGDTIESLRHFDIRTQRSTGHLQEATVLPCDDGWEQMITTVPQSRDVAPCSLFAYLPEDCILFLDEPALLRDHARQQKDALQRRLNRRDGTTAAAELTDILYDYADLEGHFEARSTLEYSLVPSKDAQAIHLDAKGQEPFNGSLQLLEKSLNRLRRSAYRVFIICDTSVQARRLEELEKELSEDVRFAVGHLHHGFLLPAAQLAVYTDHEIFRRHRLPHRRPKYEQGAPIKDFESLQPGDIVVHVDYGIGRFQGLERICAQGSERDCLSLLYQKNDKLYVPVDQLDRVQKYIGADGAVPALSKLGGTQWERTKERTKKAIAEMAQGLIRTAALRRSLPGHTYSNKMEWQKELEAAFPYEETHDQLKAAEEVMQDMEGSAPMDRLLCGDVGYGKTEIAIRAAFKAVMDHKQVAVLVPTTILAQQHLKTFQTRMKPYPVRVEMLSRFKTRAEQQRIVADLKKGTVDIVIGTHRLLQKDVRFKDLGLLIVDEEQRFGVSHKERLKHLRTSIDILTLTATPIPRTLHMSLVGARDLSIMNTAPKERLPIRTHIVHFDQDLIREAVLREIDRGGQVYFVHNRVQSIHAMANLLVRKIPEISVGIAHGQMDERSLEQVMISFLEGEFDCLVSTMIIEAGLDIPNVNTIIINRADRFGLAQLYQLRGRVGRSDKLAYAYLLVPPVKSLTETARQRLQALEEFTDLGSGFQLAMRDLEIRGAGNILGSQQHGFIAAVGFDLYCKLLEETVGELKGEPVEHPPDPRIEMALEAYIPEEYIPDSRQKMSLYQRLASITAYQDVLDIEDELRDRFGEPPKPMTTLIGAITVRALARQVGLAKISYADSTLRFEFAPHQQPKGKQIAAFISKSPISFEFEADRPLVAKAVLSGQGDEEILTLMKNTLLHLM